jgi:O-antigen/teichoic acid export membrane protein
MRQKLLTLIKHPLILGSGVIFVGSMIASLLNYVFNLEMGQSLSVADYGTFASLVSIFNIFAVFSTAIMMVFSKFSAALAGQKKENQIGSLFKAGTFWVGIMSFVISLILIAISPFLSSFFHINSILLIFITILALLFSFLSSVPLGILQGLLKFNYFSFLNIFSSIVKLGLGIAFVFAGYKVMGAIMAFFLSSVAAFLFGFIPLFRYTKQKSKDGLTLLDLHNRAYRYAVPVFLSNIGITAFITVDILLVKHYFNPIVAGQYAALSLMGRSIFYVVSPISAVLFPLIAQKKEKKESLLGTLVLSFGLVAFPSVILSLVYFVFPQTVLKIFFPSSEYVSLAKYLGLFSVFIFIYSLTFLLNSFYLSIGKINVLFFTIAGAILEGALIVLFHSSIIQIIQMLILASFLLLFSLLIYYPHASSDLNS